MTNISTKPRANDLLAQMGLSVYRAAYEKGMSLSAYLEQEDPSGEYRDGLDAFGRVLQAADLRVKALPEYGVQASTFEEFNRTEQTRALIPEWLLRTWREVQTGRPFSTRALLARVSALLKRQRARDEAEPATGVVAGKLALDPERLEAAYDGKPFTLTMTEFRVLEALARRPGIVLSRDRLLELGRDDDSIVDARLVDTYVRRLRRKIEAVAPDFDAIETVIGAGYRLRA